MIVLYVVKSKALISCMVTAQLICVFVFSHNYAKSRFSHDMALIQFCLFVFEFNGPATTTSCQFGQ